MKKLKVWVISSEFPPVFGGGISTYCYEAGLAWSSSGHEVTVFTRSAPEQVTSTTEQLREGFNVVRMPVTSTSDTQNLGYWHLMSYCFANEIVSKIQKTGEYPDMIEVQDYGAVGYFLLKQKLAGMPELKNIKIIVYSHTPTFELSKINQEPSYLFPNYWLGQCEKFCLRAADAVLSPSEFLKTHIEAYTPNSIEVIPYSYFGESDERVVDLSSIKAEFDCVYLGRLEYRKGVLHLLKAFKGIWDSGQNISLKLVGGDTVWVPKQISVKSHIEKTYSKYIDSGLLTIGSAVPPDQLPNVFVSGKIVVVPSIYENFPYVCMQAMNLARPILASLSGGQAEMVGSDGTCGAIFNWDRPESFSEELLKLLRKTPQELKAIGFNSRKKIREYCSIEKFITARQNHLQKLIDTPSNSHLYPFDDSKGLHPTPEKRQSHGERGKVSIVIPFYNLAEFLPETIASIKSSSYSNYEIILVNDGSTDEASIALLSGIKSTESNVKVIDITNAGLANARNVGAQAATGEFIAFLDADDCVEPEYYTKCVQMLNQYDNVSFVYSWVKYFGESDAVWVNFDTEFPYLLAGNMLAAFQVIRKQDFLECGTNDSDMVFGMEDYEAWLRMVTQGKRGVSIPEPLVKYRVRLDSMARQFKRNTILYMYEQIATKNDKIYKAYGSELFMLINANGPGYLWNNPTMNYPQIGYASSSVTPKANSVTQVNLVHQLSIGETMRLKSIITHPFVSKIVRAALRFKLDKYFKN